MSHLVAPLVIAAIALNSLVRFVWHAMWLRKGRTSRVLAALSAVAVLGLFAVIYAHSLRTRTYLAMTDDPNNGLLRSLFEGARNSEEWMLRNLSVFGHRFEVVQAPSSAPVLGFVVLMAIRAGIYFFAGRRRSPVSDAMSCEEDVEGDEQAVFDGIDGELDAESAEQIEPDQARRANSNLWGSVYWTHGTAYFLLLCALTSAFGLSAVVVWPIGLLTLLVAPIAIRFSVLSDFLSIVGTLMGVVKDVVIVGWGYVTDVCVRMAGVYRKLLTGSTEWYRRTVSAPLNQRLSRLSDRSDGLRRVVEDRFDATESSFATTSAPIDIRSSDPTAKDPVLVGSGQQNHSRTRHGGDDDRQDR